MINSSLERLSEFPFRRLAALLADQEPGGTVFDLALGEPQHDPPAMLAQTVSAHAHLWHRYPPTNGTSDYRRAVTEWLIKRYHLPAEALDPDKNVLPLAGTKEGLFSVMSVIVGAQELNNRPTVIMPSPLYATIFGGAVMAGAEPVFAPARRETEFLPDLSALSEHLLERCAIFYLCSPANPQGAVADEAYLIKLIELSHRHDFILMVDECYSEIYRDRPPKGALEVAHSMKAGFERLLVFNSLSKRSNAPGLRSGFVAGAPDILKAFLRLRGYSAPVQPLPLMAAGAALWRDEEHVEANRERYRRKFANAAEKFGDRLGFYNPPGGFFLWLDVGNGIEAAQSLWRRAGVKALPGAFLAEPDTEHRNPGDRYLRIAMVQDETILDQALDDVIETLT